jgi:hypothetical protein
MVANNILSDKVKMYLFGLIKVNKHDTIYQGVSSNPVDTFITEFVKIEKFQGYSKAFNLGLYFRIKNKSSWAKSKQITGLWKTQIKSIYYGDFKELNSKTLLLFKIDEVNDKLIVYEFPKGYFPHKVTIENYALKIQ